jgi:hypothetical protein
MPFLGRGEGRNKRRSLPQDRVLFLAEARPLIAEAKAYEESHISNGNRILTGRNVQQLKRHYHEVRYSPRLCLPSRRL